MSSFDENKMKEEYVEKNLSFQAVWAVSTEIFNCLIHARREYKRKTKDSNIQNWKPVILFFSFSFFFCAVVSSQLSWNNVFFTLTEKEKKTKEWKTYLGSVVYFFLLNMRRKQNVEESREGRDTRRWYSRRKAIRCLYVREQQNIYKKRHTCAYMY